MLYALIIVGAIGCAIEAIRAKRLLVSALWLAGASALVSVILYLLGAPQVAVIELSVGAGLVTVLFVFAINLAGEETLDDRPVIPRPVSWVMIILSVGLLGALNLPWLNQELAASAPESITAMLWEQRGLDVLVQVALVFSGVLGVLGLLAESHRITHREAHS